MTPVTHFAGKHVALFGLGGSGLVTAQALVQGGAHVTVWDDQAQARAKAQALNLTLSDLHIADWSQFSALILAPGVPLTHPTPHWTVEKARSANIEIIGDIELFCRERARLAPHAPFIAITGTNGKSTTTALIAHILQSAGHNVQLGGNIGTPILALEPPADDKIHVIECSSFQIDLAPSLNPTIGIITNLSPDHLDRHGTMEAYAAVKERLVAQSQTALVSLDDGFSRLIYDHLKSRTDLRTIPLSLHHSGTQGLSVENHKIIATFNGPTILGTLTGLRTLRCAHNAQNAAYAAGAAHVLNLSQEQIQQGLNSFPGLAHRMEEVGRIDHVLFINDSKATNADAAEKALLSFDDIFWILGGKAKDGGIASLAPLFPKIRKAYLIGEAVDDFAKTLNGHVPFVKCGALAAALHAASTDALQGHAPEAVVLLSPACASYDQFQNFEHRGDSFRSAVQALIAQQNVN